MHTKDKTAIGRNRLRVLPLIVLLIAKINFYYLDLRCKEAPLRACLKKRYSSAPGHTHRGSSLTLLEAKSAASTGSRFSALCVCFCLKKAATAACYPSKSQSPSAPASRKLHHQAELL